MGNEPRTLADAANAIARAANASRTKHVDQAAASGIEQHTPSDAPTPGDQGKATQATR